MPSEAADVALAVLDAFNRRDIAAIRPLIADGAEIYPLRAQLEGNPAFGPEGLVDAITAADGDWEDLRLEPGEVHELPDGVVVMARFRARGRASHADIDVPTGWHFRVSAGKVDYSRGYSKPEEALRAAGAESATD